MTFLSAPITVYTQTNAAGFDWTSFDCSPFVPKDAKIAWIWVKSVCHGSGHSCSVYVRPNSISPALEVTSTDATLSASDVSSDTNFMAVQLDPNTQRFEYKATIVNDASVTVEFRAYQ